jgi:hypothetical protein
VLRILPLFRPRMEINRAVVNGLGALVKPEMLEFVPKVVDKQGRT